MLLHPCVVVCDVGYEVSVMRCSHIVSVVTTSLFLASR